MNQHQTAVFNDLLKAYKGEALFRPSSASRILNCPASVYLGAKAPRDRRSSKYAQEGTAAHTVLEQALSGERQPDEWTDRAVSVDNGAASVIVTDEMTDAIQAAVVEVRERINEDTEMFLEHFLSLQPIDPDNPLLAENRGTADVVLVDKRRRKLTIMDLKYGVGVMVAGDSPQLLDYALMGLINFQVEGGWAEVEVVVLQPRARNEWERVKAHTFSPDDLLMDFVGRLVGAMEASLDPSTPLNVDPTGGWCRWCPAKTICPALQAAGLAATGADIMVSAALSATSPMPPIPKNPPALPDPNSMSGDDLATVLDRKKVWEAWIEAVEERALHVKQQGTPVGNYEVAQRLGNRTWKNPQEAEAIIRTQLGVSILDMYPEPKLKSPAQMEKLIEKSKRNALDDLVERPLGDLYLKANNTVTGKIK